jgi:hypothetical protein
MSRLGTLVRASVVLGAAVIMLPTKAHAAGTRYFHSSLCRAITSTGTASSNAILNAFGQLEITAGSGVTTVWCPLITDPTVSEIPALSSVLVSVYENGGTSQQGPFSAEVCRAPAAGGSPVCGAQSFLSGSPGVSFLPLPMPSVNVGDYLYIRIFVGPHTSTGGDNAIFGYRLVNP